MHAPRVRRAEPSTAVRLAVHTTYYVSVTRAVVICAATTIALSGCGVFCGAGGGSGGAFAGVCATGMRF